MSIKKILIVDNNDSFTYNLFHQVKECTECTEALIEIKKINSICVEDLNSYDYFIISPGPGLPDEKPKLKELIKFCYDNDKPLLGVCLGHQAIAEFFGGKLKNLEEPFHGIKSKIIRTYANSFIFKNMPQFFYAGKYHSWIVENENFPTELEVTSLDDFGNIMSFSHKYKNISGIQFHPESIMTDEGHIIMKNFLI